jgi:hypothetical protein
MVATRNWGFPFLPPICSSLFSGMADVRAAWEKLPWHNAADQQKSFSKRKEEEEEVQKTTILLLLLLVLIEESSRILKTL